MKKIDIGIFPGSRESEIKNNLFTMLDCIKQSKNTMTSIRILRFFILMKLVKK